MQKFDNSNYEKNLIEFKSLKINNTVEINDWCLFLEDLDSNLSVNRNRLGTENMLEKFFDETISQNFNNFNIKVSEKSIEDLYREYHINIKKIAPNNEIKHCLITNLLLGRYVNFIDSIEIVKRKAFSLLLNELGEDRFNKLDHKDIEIIFRKTILDYTFSDNRIINIIGDYDLIRLNLDSFPLDFFLDCYDSKFSCLIVKSYFFIAYFNIKSNLVDNLNKIYEKYNLPFPKINFEELKKAVFHMNVIYNSSEEFIKLFENLNFQNKNDWVSHYGGLFLLEKNGVDKFKLFDINKMFFDDNENVDNTYKFFNNLFNGLNIVNDEKLQNFINFLITYQEKFDKNNFVSFYKDLFLKNNEERLSNFFYKLLSRKKELTKPHIESIISTVLSLVKENNVVFFNKITNHIIEELYDETDRLLVLLMMSETSDNLFNVYVNLIEKKIDLDNINLIMLGLLISKFFKYARNLEMENFIIKFLDKVRVTDTPINVLKSIDLSNVEKYKKNETTLGYFFITSLIKSELIYKNKKLFTRSEWFFDEKKIMNWANPNNKTKFDAINKELEKYVNMISSRTLIDTIYELFKYREDVILKIQNSNVIVLLNGEYIYFINNLLLELENQVKEFLKIQKVSHEKLPFAIDLFNNNIKILKQGLINISSHYE